MNKPGTISQRDLETLAHQLGREPRGVLSVERYCPAGHPQVIKVYPLIENDPGAFEPFPTIFWLSCPMIVQQIAELEHQGLIAQLEALIQSDPDLRARHLNDHRAYQEERWNLLTEEDKALVERDRRWRTAFQHRGIGGLSNFEHVKCLHMHYAHHLSRKNVIGQWIEEHYQIRECLPGDVFTAAKPTSAEATRQGGFASRIRE